MKSPRAFLFTVPFVIFAANVANGNTLPIPVDYV